jgi:competence protein ComEC
MSELRVTLIDVGWGDSILIEASDTGGSRPRFALVDSNDNAEKDYWPSYNFLRKHFGLREDEFTVAKPFFDFVMVTHDHSDHGTGLKRIMQKYGTLNFWHPRVTEDESVVVTSLQAYTRHHMVQIPNEAIDTQTDTYSLGDVEISFLWPPPGQIDNNPNNNSIVMSLRLGQAVMLLTGDAEGEVWDQIAANIPADTRVFKVPHHGSRNGTIHHGQTPWIDQVPGLNQAPLLGISCHPNFPNRYDFPHQDVLSELDDAQLTYYRTDMDYHLTFIYDDTAGGGVQVKYSHV